MATSALNAAATGLGALSTQIDVIANNLANVNTTGFRRSRVNFEDLLYQQLAAAGTKNSEGSTKPAGIFIGLGVRVSNTQTMFNQGNLDSTDRELDVAIDGDGFFQVKIPNTFGTEVGYTRAGNLGLTPDGELVLGNSDGFKLEPPISIPAEATRVDIATDGKVYVTIPSAIEPQEVGQIQLARFSNPAGLRPIAGTLFVETESSGPPTTAYPTEQGMGRLLQKFVEASNVDPVRELVELIRAQRAFELNSQSIQSADEMLQVVANLRRF